MVIVVDNSALIPLFLPDEPIEYTSRLLQSIKNNIYLLAPSLLIAEFGNTIATALRRKRITSSEAARAHKEFSNLPMEIANYPSIRSLPQIHNLAEKNGLTFYDATYLSLALNQKAAIASLDKQLLTAARAEGVEIFA